MEDFGNYIEKKRRDKNFTLTDIASKLKISVPYMSDIINGKRNPPDIKKLEILSNILNLSRNERNKMFDLAGKAREQVSPDIVEYIMDDNNLMVRETIRNAQEKKLGNEFWIYVNEEIEK